MIATQISLGPAFRHLRESKEMTQADMAAKLQEYGLKITDRSSVFHLEERGSGKHTIIRAYSLIFNMDVSDIEKLAERLSQQTV